MFIIYELIFNIIKKCFYRNNSNVFCFCENKLSLLPIKFSRNII